jgi:hypothetical protein
VVTTVASNNQCSSVVMPESLRPRPVLIGRRQVRTQGGKVCMLEALSTVIYNNQLFPLSVPYRSRCAHSPPPTCVAPNVRRFCARWAAPQPKGAVERGKSKPGGKGDER